MNVWAFWALRILRCSLYRKFTCLRLLLLLRLALLAGRALLVMTGLKLLDEWQLLETVLGSTGPETLGIINS